jgi:hypothetical protein
VATVFVVLFFGDLLPVTALGGMPYFPGPTASVNEMVTFFSQRQGGPCSAPFCSSVLRCHLASSQCRWWRS